MAIGRDPGESHEVIAGSDPAQGHLATRAQCPLVAAVEQNGVAVRVRGGPGGSGADLEGSAGRLTGDLECDRRDPSGVYTHRARILTPDRAVPGYAGRTHRVIPWGNVGAAEGPSGGDRLGWLRIHLHHVAVRIRLDATGGGRHQRTGSGAVRDSPPPLQLTVAAISTTPATV